MPLQFPNCSCHWDENNGNLQNVGLNNGWDSESSLSHDINLEKNVSTPAAPHALPNVPAHLQLDQALPVPEFG